MRRLSTGNLPWQIGTIQSTKLKIESQNPKQNHKTQNRITKPKTESQNLKNRNTRLKTESQNYKTESQNPKRNHKTQNRITKLKTETQNLKRKHKTKHGNMK